jgi:hypothetical protein
MEQRISKGRLKRIAAQLRQEFASLGGVARAKALTKRRRKEIASMGGKAGGRGRKKKVPVKKAAV